MTSSYSLEANNVALLQALFNICHLSLFNHVCHYFSSSEVYSVCANKNPYLLRSDTVIFGLIIRSNQSSLSLWTLGLHCTRKLLCGRLTMTTRPIPSTPELFRTEYPDQARTSELLNILRKSHISASKWSRRHLEALRVLRILAPGDGHLPILQPHYDTAMKQLRESENGSILVQLRNFNKFDVMRHTQSELRRQCPQLGSYYAKLVNLFHSNPPAAPVQTSSPSVSPVPTRSRQRPLQSGFVTGEGLGFSSPPSASGRIDSSPSFAPSVNAPIDRSEYEDRVKSEEVSRAVASEFLSAICDLTRDPTSDRNSGRLEFTLESHRYTIPSAWYNLWGRRIFCRKDIS